MSAKQIKLLAAKVYAGITTLEEIKKVYGEEVANKVEAVINANN